MLIRPPGPAAALCCALLAATTHLPLPVHAQERAAPPDAARILHQMQKLQVVGTVLYVAAHPDDENTKLIAWLANGRKTRTGYLSLTRGDGGQNLIGPELGDALGIIRTEELMAARRIDGGEQFFTRASDFGFSKNAAESFAKWGHDAILADVVRVIRNFRPDVVITRFPPDRTAGHGHHEASALLAAEAFDLAGDPAAFPEQLQQGLQPWQPKRLFFNGSTWWNKDLPKLAANDPEWYSVDVGGYDPLLGLSYTELAGKSRSMHKSQGFGAPETRGEQLEYLRFVKGERPAGKDFLGGLDLTWKRLPGGPAVAKAVDAMLKGYDARQPWKSTAALEGVAAKLGTLPATAWKNHALDIVHQLLLDVSGTVVEALAPAPQVVTGDSLRVALSVLCRSDVPVQLKQGNTLAPLPRNKEVKTSMALRAPLNPDEPFWLARPHGNMFDIEDPAQIGLAVAPTQLQVPWTLRFPGGTEVSGSAPVIYRTVDRVKGDVVQYCEVVPPVSLSCRPGLLLVKDADTASTLLVAEPYTDLLHLQVRAELMGGWQVMPQETDFGPLKNGGTALHPLKVLAEEGAGSNSPYLRANTDHAGPAGLTRRTVHYEHIPQRSWYTRASFRVEPLDAKVNAKRVGYIMGAGDEVPTALEMLGLQVDLIDPATATAQDLRPYDAIVVGVRAYNTVHALKPLNPLLMQYVHNGGTMLVQYITQSTDMVLPDSLIGPYPFKLSRGRVTVEEAEPAFLHPDHPLLNLPNKITAKDFEGWVQERGLYFAGERDPHYTALIAWHDPGEEPLDGALITCKYGQGRFIYTGISFFRQLPAGVPGAYRLLANLVSKP